MDRAKFETTAPADEAEAETPKNPVRHFHRASARPPGRSGKGVVKTAKRSTRKRSRSR